MPRSSVPPELLNRLADALDATASESSKLLEEVAALKTASENLKSTDDALDKRVIALEAEINGKGEDPGLKTRVALLKQESSNKKESKQNWLVILGLIISLVMGIAGLLKDLT